MKKKILMGILMTVIVTSLVAPITDRQAPEAKAMYSLMECQLAADFGWQRYTYNMVCLFAMQAEGIGGDEEDWGWY